MLTPDKVCEIPVCHGRLSSLVLVQCMCVAPSDADYRTNISFRECAIFLQSSKLTKVNTLALNLKAPTWFQLHREKPSMYYIFQTGIWILDTILVRKPTVLNISVVVLSLRTRSYTPPSAMLQFQLPGLDRYIAMLPPTWLFLRSTRCPNFSI